MFPPSESVTKGAFWTAYCNETGRCFSEGLIDEKIPFEVEGFYIKKDEKYYIPCPTTWYYDSEKKVSLGKELNGKKLVVAKDCSEIFNTLGMSSSAGKIVFVKPEVEAQPLLGAWICVDYFKNTNGVFAIKLNADTMFQRDANSVKNTTNMESNTCHIKE
jgi:hypothetical protein